MVRHDDVSDYLDRPFHSPIKVHEVRAIDAAVGVVIDLDFYNLGHAQGVRNMTYRLSLLRAEPGSLVFFRTDPYRRDEIAPLSLGWAKVKVSCLYEALRPLAGKGVPIVDATAQIRAARDGW